MSVRPGMVEAQLVMAQLYLDGGLPDEAFAVLEIAARSGEPAALNMLGRAYERGWGVPRDPATAARWFARAASGGDAWARFNLADLLLTGDGVPRDRAHAYALYAAAARGGVVKALNMLGLLHEDGAVQPRAPRLATAFYRAAAEAEDCWGCLNLARLLLEAGETDPALPWLRRALACGFSDSFRAMARMFGDHADARVAALASEAARRVGPT